MRYGARFSVLLALLALTPEVRAAEPAPEATAAPSFGDRFFRGTSPGALPASKAVVVGGLYLGAIASVSLGAVLLVQAGDQSDETQDFKLSQPPGFCADLASPPCGRYRRLLGEERALRTGAVGLLGLGGLLAVGGALTAEFWPNEADAPRLGLALAPGSALFTTTARF